VGQLDESLQLATTHPTDPSTFFDLSPFGKFFYLVFNYTIVTKKVAYLDQSISRHTDLADRFTATSQELGTVTTSALLDRSRQMDDGGPEDDERTGKYSGIMKGQHKLLTERDALISQIRGLSGLENVLLRCP
jgi:hypothetical protein